MRDGFVFYRSFAEAIEGLPSDEYKAVMLAICHYALDEEMPQALDPVSNAIFTLIKPQLDANNRRYENGKKGGRPKKAEPNENQTITKLKPNNNQSKTEVKPKEKEKVKDKDIFSNENIKDPILLDAMKSYAEYRKKIKAPLTDRAVALALNKLEELAPGNSAQKAEIINQSIMNGWKGLFALKSGRVNDHHGITRDDDLDDIATLQAMRLHNGIGLHGL